MKSRKNTLLVILGPTASGKTGIAVEVAKHFNTEIISADSRQFYKEIPIGTAAPDKKDLSEVKHHFVGHLSIFDEYNISRFEKDVLGLLKQKFQQHSLMVMAGGSGMYLDAVCNGIDELPDPDEKIRSELNKTFAEKGIEALQQQLKKLDLPYYHKVDLQNPKRLMRAIEVCLQTGKRFSDLRKHKPASRDFNIIKIGLFLPRETLYSRINQRTDMMIKTGWLDEARAVYPYKHLNSLNTVGYKELFNYLSGEWPLEKAIEKIKTNTRRYAKRQITWFKRDNTINWLHPDNIQTIIKFAENRI
jgi:tRNA dimethylallyltransferase